jgi:hypothetical protein
MGRAVPGVDVRIDEARRHEFVGCVNFPINRSFEFFADEDDLASFVDKFGIAPQHMTGLSMAHKPSARNARSH